MQLKGVDEIIYRQIEVLCDKRLKKSVTPFEVMRWLQNFKENEYSIALKILQYIDVYSENELIEFWNERLKELLNIIPNETYILLNPVAEIGKSGTLMLYYLKKSPVFQAHEKRFTIYANPEQIKHKKKGNSIPKNSVVILIDDFSGSGRSVLSHYKHFIKPQIKDFENVVGVYAIMLFCLQKAVNLLHRNASEIKLIYELKQKAFSATGSVFGYRGNMQPIRDFSYKYGSGLWLTEDNKGQVVDNPLGFENSQALIVFPYNPPNNTIPIIWSSKNGWNPLYPRNPQYKISEAKRIRKELASYISFLDFTDYAFDFKSGVKDMGWKTIHFVTKTDFHAFALLFLMRKKRSKPTIRQLLGITETDYNLKIEELKIRSMLDKDGNISEYGEEIYLQVLRQLRNERKNLRVEKNGFEIKKIVYLPKQFRGEALT